MSETKQIPSPAVYIATLINTSLPQSVQGDKNRIAFIKPLPVQIAKAVVEGEVWARLGCRAQKGEWVKIRKGSYSSSNNSAEIIRGVSGYYDGSIGEVVDFTGQNDLQLVFGETIPPSIIQKMSEAAFEPASLSTLPIAKVGSAGLVELAYRIQGQATNVASRVVAVDGPAHVQLYKSVFGTQTYSYNNLELKDEEMQRAQILGQLIGLFASRPSNYEKVQQLLAILTDETLFTNFKKFLDLMKSDAKYSKLNDLLK